MFELIRASVVLFALLSAITGLAYPALVTLLAAAFPHQASGSVTTENGVAYSELLGQAFTSPKYFWSRPSGTSPQPYNGGSSGASNLGPTNPDLVKAVKERIEALRAADPENKAPVPVDLVTASGSGLDPHLSPAAAEFQVARVAKARGMTAESVRTLVARYTEGRTFGVLGEPRVHVVKLNLALDAASRKP